MWDRNLRQMKSLIWLDQFLTNMISKVTVHIRILIDTNLENGIHL